MNLPDPSKTRLQKTTREKEALLQIGIILCLGRFISPSRCPPGWGGSLQIFPSGGRRDPSSSKFLEEMFTGGKTRQRVTFLRAARHASLLPRCQQQQQQKLTCPVLRQLRRSMACSALAPLPAGRPRGLSSFRCSALAFWRQGVPERPWSSSLGFVSLHFNYKYIQETQHTWEFPTAKSLAPYIRNRHWKGNGKGGNQHTETPNAEPCCAGKRELSSSLTPQQFISSAKVHKCK